MVRPSNGDDCRAEKCSPLTVGWVVVSDNVSIVVYILSTLPWMDGSQTVKSTPLMHSPIADEYHLLVLLSRL